MLPGRAMLRVHLRPPVGVKVAVGFDVSGGGCASDAVSNFLYFEMSINSSYQSNDMSTFLPMMYNRYQLAASLHRQPLNACLM